MRSKGLLAIAILSVSILSYGFNGSVFGDSHNIPPVSVSTELPSYEQGDRLVIKGSIKNFDPEIDAGKAIALIVKDPEGNFVGFAQLIPESDGTFSTDSIIAGGKWKINGDYVIEVTFDNNVGKTTVVYTGGEDKEPTPPEDVEPEPEPPLCDSDQTLKDGKCVDKETRDPEPPQCDSDQTLVDGECMDKEPEPEPEPLVCGPGTEEVNGQCQAITEPDDGSGGCLIATAAFGTELAPQIQFLREVRDNTVMSTASGASFMTGFNQLYYSFSPTIADWERQNPVFQETVRAFITPMISTLSIMTLADEGSEAQVLGAGISIIMLNLGMYIAAPALIGFKVHKYLKNNK